jgi:hypothetical protein
MERKLHRHVRMHVVAHQYASLGFVTKRLNAQHKYNIIPNLELLAEIRAQFGKTNVPPAKPKDNPLISETNEK